MSKLSKKLDARAQIQLAIGELDEDLDLMLRLDTDLTDDQKRSLEDAGGTIAAGGTATIELRVPQNVVATVFIEIWCNDANELGIAVTPPREPMLAEVIANTDVPPNVATTAAASNVITVVDRDMDSTGETQITLALRAELGR